MHKKGITLQLLWEEYVEAHSGVATYRYTQFCSLYHDYSATLKRSMRQIHRAGEKLFIDYAGPIVPLVDLEWSPQRLLDWGRDIGPNTHCIVDYQLTSKPHPEMGYRACLGLLSLAREYGKQRLEAACARAVALGALNRRSVINILKSGLDNKPLPMTPTEQRAAQADWVSPLHDNVRGPSYFH
jgi:transposase